MTAGICLFFESSLVCLFVTLIRRCCQRPSWSHGRFLPLFLLGISSTHLRALNFKRKHVTSRAAGRPVDPSIRRRQEQQLKIYRQGLEPLLNAAAKDPSHRTATVTGLAHSGLVPLRRLTPGGTANDLTVRARIKPGAMTPAERWEVGTVPGPSHCL